MVPIVEDKWAEVEHEIGRVHWAVRGCKNKVSRNGEDLWVTN